MRPARDVHLGRTDTSFAHKVYVAERVSTSTVSPRRSRGRYRKGSPWVLRCPASAKFPAWPACWLPR
ncbi:hypothetical protein [Streptomyces sp. enrichment culture]|uniref:hypothetical protein n=1 Tax=Streptomyces sp. enrichment culture TaxID=1795815 RepID=UPI003F55BA89